MFSIVTTLDLTEPNPHHRGPCGPKGVGRLKQAFSTKMLVGSKMVIFHFFDLKTSIFKLQFRCFWGDFKKNRWLMVFIDFLAIFGHFCCFFTFFRHSREIPLRTLFCQTSHTLHIFGRFWTLFFDQKQAFFEPILV